ncbi:MAG: hypothetical protein N3B16_02370 [Candidatus Aminicenantes bacterium]|nr:hypothetical protein [Candidatus Aminicenantes bacterium]
MIIPALVGGVAAGFLSSLPLANCFCCLWIILGAFLAVFLYSRDLAKPLSLADGLLLGILSGLVATIIDFFLSIPFQAINAALASRFLETLAQFTEEIPFNWDRWLERSEMARLGFPLIFFTLILRTFIFVGLGAVGGALGVAFFGRRKRGSVSVDSKVEEEKEK